MTLPTLDRDFNDAGDPVVLVGDSITLTEPSQILEKVPALGDPCWSVAYAQLAVHLAHGDRFSVIFEPETFKAEYMEEYNSEAEEAPPGYSGPRLRDFGVPDFAAIRKPVHEGGVLTFFAVNHSLGLPYQATLAPGGKVEFTPVAMVE